MAALADKDYTVDSATRRWNRATKSTCKIGENVDSRFQVELEDDGGDSARQKWVEASDYVTYVPLKSRQPKSMKTRTFPDLSQQRN